MKTIIFVSALIAGISAAAFQKPDQTLLKVKVPEVEGILKQSSDIYPDGTYSYEYETANGISAAESGTGGVNALGEFKYVAPDGTPIELSYIADDEGYKPSGSHLPTPPPIPEQIMRALEYLRLHAVEEESLIGSSAPKSKPSVGSSNVKGNKRN